MVDFISFIGIDGSGKTTQAILLKYFLLKKGYDVKYLWASGRGNIFVSFIILSLAKFLKLIKKENVNGRTISHYKHFNRLPMSFIWPFAQLVDSILFRICVKLFLTINEVDFIIFDRCFIDTYIDVLVDTHLSLRSPYTTLFFALLPRQSRIFFLDLNVENAYVRKDDIPNKKYLSERKKYYDLFSKYFLCYKIDAGNDIVTINEDILKILTNFAIL